MFFSWALHKEGEKVPVKVCICFYMQQVTAWIVNSGDKPNT